MGDGWQSKRVSGQSSFFTTRVTAAAAALGEDPHRAQKGVPVGYGAEPTGLGHATPTRHPTKWRRFPKFSGNTEFFFF
jgi:hypothetical protein